MRLQGILYRMPFLMVCVPEESFKTSERARLAQ
jgi:hypothetical protein